MIFSATVVCLEWSDSMTLGLNNDPNQSAHNTAFHESTDLVTDQ